MEVQEEDFDLKTDPWFALIVPILKLIQREKLAKAALVGERLIPGVAERAFWRPPRRPARRLRERLANYARVRLGQDIRADLCTCAAFIDRFASP